MFDVLYAALLIQAQVEHRKCVGGMIFLVCLGVVLYPRHR